MTWQAYLDESIDDDLFVLAGYLAPAESWTSFAKEWEEALPLGCLGSDDRYRFKMSEMASRPERMARVPAFFRIIEKYKLIPLSVTMRHSDLERARQRIILLDDKLETATARGPVIDNTYFLVFMRFLQSLHHEHNRMKSGWPMSPDEKIEFIFDDRAEKKSITSAWNDLLESNPRRNLYGPPPRFENDDDFLPLQAADFLAWWARVRASTAPQKKVKFPCTPRGGGMWISAKITEDNIVMNIVAMINNQRDHERGGHRYVAYDKKSLIETSLPTDLNSSFYNFADYFKGF